ncbi:MAG: hypothetical protein ACHQ01_04140 [Candidatus Limnocylindrales bacterium]
MATDVPVHKSLITGPANQMMLTPYIRALNALGHAGLDELMPATMALRGRREEVFPYLRRASLSFLRGDGAGVTAALSDSPAADSIDFSMVDPVELLRVAFSEYCEPLGKASLIEDAITEADQVVEDARATDGVGLEKLLTALEGGPLPEHCKRVFDTTLTLLEDAAAIEPAMWADRIDAIDKCGEFRVMRDDFDLLKVRYQDVFELGSRSLALMARVANIARRGDVSRHADGRTRSLNDALNHTTARHREAWLVDFPAAKYLYDAVARHTRNDIGHRLVRYDIELGSLVFDDGTEENYLLFLVDYLEAVRLSHYLVDRAMALRTFSEPGMGTPA